MNDGNVDHSYVTCPYGESCPGQQCGYWHNSTASQPFYGYMGYVASESTTVTQRSEPTTTTTTLRRLPMEEKPVMGHIERQQRLVEAQERPVMGHIERQQRLVEAHLGRRMQQKTNIPSRQGQAAARQGQETSIASRQGQAAECIRSVNEIDEQIEQLKKKIGTPSSVIGLSIEKKSIITLPTSSGYTPTPISVLEKKGKEEPSTSKEKKTETMKMAKKTETMTIAKKTETMTIDELFEEPPPKKEKKTPKMKQDKTEMIDKSKQDKTTEMIDKSKTTVILKKTIPDSPDRIRVAHSAVQQAVPSNVEIDHRHRAQVVPSNMETDHRHRAQVVSSSFPSIVKTDSHRQNALAASVLKGENRVAHRSTIASASVSSPALTPLDPQLGKVPMPLRQKYLEMFNRECLKFATPSDAREIAQREEKAIRERSNTRSGYTSAAVNVLRRLRECVAAQSTPSNVNRTLTISHNAQLLGKHHNSITIGERRKSSMEDGRLSEGEFYEILNDQFLMSTDQLRSNGYPLRNPDRPGFVSIATNQLDAKKKYFYAANDLKRICCRCGTEYLVKENGLFVVAEECVYHWGRAWKTKTNGVWETRYNCCSADLSTRGCCMAECHVSDGLREMELSSFIETPPSMGMNDERNTKVYAMDCEMVYTVHGPALARVTVVDMRGDAILDLLVRPDHTVTDCNQRFSGLTLDQVENAGANLKQAQERLFELMNAESIIIGHSLESDLKALRLVHHRVVDTSIVFPHRLGPPYKKALKTVSADILQKIIQEDVEGHDSKEDALVCMQLMLHKTKNM